MHLSSILVLALASLPLLQPRLSFGETISRTFLEEKAYAASAAHQAVAVDRDSFYAIANRKIGKHEKSTGMLVARYEAAADSPLRHLNSGVAVGDRLYCAHSNWPNLPYSNSIEVWDAKTLKHLASQLLDEKEAAITWIDQKQGTWWGVFARYGNQELVEKSVLTRFDEHWKPDRSWSFPPEIVERFLPYSCSGGAWGPDGLLYVTGHDRSEIYVLRVPAEEATLELVEILSAPMAGQGIAWDHAETGLLYGIRRKARQVVVARLQQSAPKSLTKWLEPQHWQRDTPGPVVQLGEPGAFDDTHLLAPCVGFENGLYRMWYCGSSGKVAERVYHLGLASSDDGKSFQRLASHPVFSFGDDQHSILTPAMLRNSRGEVIREDGQLRMWFSATHFAGPTGLHTLHETNSSDGVAWSEPSPPQLDHVYAPTILKEDTIYRMWYVDVSTSPWLIRHAESPDGKHWQVRPQPVLVIDQAWEQSRLFYPYVVKADGVYLMWYGSYWNDHPQQTALGFAASSDGLEWIKHPQNPVLRPDPGREWESHYTTSESVLQLADGSWRIWFASRKAPPFLNKYFAINTAHWAGPE
ncbi:MAG: hypothetical protein KDA57_17060 [Planctomycetales bacterium]|nr:hypothetical protein [Planctomycetales bacterium]